MASNSQVGKTEFSESRTSVDEGSFTEEAPELPAHLKGIYFLNVRLLSINRNFTYFKERDKKKEEEEELEKDFGDMEIEIGSKRQIKDRIICK